jgi:hypothetical protein
MMKTSRRSHLATLTLPLLLALGGCEGATDAQLFSLDEPTGRIEAVFFADLDRSGTVSAGDRPLEEVWVSLRFRGTLDTIATVRTEVTGEVTFAGLAPGAMELLIEPSALGDSLVVSSQTPSPLVVIRRDVNPVQVGVSYPIVSIADARGSQAGRRLFVEGVAVNASGSLPGNALHVRSDAGWLRAENVTGQGVSAGDSVRMRGTVARVGGSVVFQQGLVARLSGTGLVQPVVTTTQGARNATGGLDGALVRIQTATVNQTVVQGGVATSQISDGSGALMVQIPTAHLAEANLPAPLAGSTLSLTGVLIPQSGGTSWMLRTRSGADLGITSTGALRARVFIDEDRTGAFSAGDVALPGVRVLVRAAQVGGGVVAEGSTGSDGFVQLSGLPTGAYVLELDPFTYPQNLALGPITPSPAVVESAGTTEVAVPLLRPASAPPR